MNDFITTGDGTITMLDPETGELYHNRAGAYTEAMRNYVEPSGALKRLKQNGQIRVLDCCFGLGYNSLVLFEEAIRHGAEGSIVITAIECDGHIIKTTKDVVQCDKFESVRAFFGCDDFACEFGHARAARDYLQIKVDLVQGDLREVIPALQEHFDFIFHDPFSPRKVPELWTIELFAEYYRLLKRHKGAVLTYSSAGAVRGGLQQAGFHVYQTAAVGAKAGGTLASTEPLSELPSGVQSLSDDEVTKLRGKSGIPYRDDNFSRAPDLIHRTREAEQAAHT